MTIVRDETSHPSGLAIVDKYESFQLYLYQALENCPQRHRVARDAAIAAMFRPIEDLYHAAQSQQVSRLRAADAAFATMRSHLRFLAHPHVRVISQHQHEVALARLSEPGRMLNAWMRKLTGSRIYPTSADENPKSGKPGLGGHAGK